MGKTKSDTYDVAVIGGGPSGMFAAARAASLGARVVLVEKNDSVGKKLLITGGGRCNMTNAEFDNRKFLEKLGKGGKFLFSTFSSHAVKDSLDFFHNRGVETKVENEGRVFPVTDDARTVWNALVEYMLEGKVDVMTEIAGTGFHVRDGVIVGLNTETDTVVANNYILATGGTSHPETGSTGEAFDWLSKIGHTIKPSESALVPVKIKDTWVRKMSGVSHQSIKLSILENGKRVESRVGRMVFTDFGMSGPLVLNMSKDIKESMSYGNTELSLDLLPNTLPDAIDKQILATFAQHSNKKIKNSLAELIPPAFVTTILDISKVDPEKETNILSREERLSIGKTIKDMRMTPSGFLSPEKAIVASGGVALEEVDFKTMQSRLFPNLYFVGDVLDIERPSGGYSLQLCWTTGFVAGTHSAQKKN